MDKEHKKIIIVLHEIYGINNFIKGICKNFMNAGFDVICPDLIGRPPFLYEQEEEAYEYFTRHIGFDVYKKISQEVNQLKAKYEKVFIVGFSVGATLAWRCSENPLCDGIIGCYGSRIRDYSNVNPVCSTFLLFAKEMSYDVDLLVSQLGAKTQLKSLKFEVRHGFMDPFSKCFDQQVSKCAEKIIYDFLWEREF